MKLLPEKVEGKLFIITLVICLGASLLFSQIILSTERDRLIRDIRTELVSHSEQHNLNLIIRMNERQAIALKLVNSLRGSLRTRPLDKDEVVANMRTSESGKRFGVWEASGSGFILDDGQELTPEVTERIAHAATVMNESSAEMMAKFVEMEVELGNGIHILAPIRHVFARANEQSTTSRDLSDLHGTSEQATWSDLAFDNDRQVWLSSVSVPIREKDRVVGYLRATALADDIISDVHAYTITGSSGEGYIVDAQGDILVHEALTSALNSRSRSGRGPLPPDESGEPIVQALYAALVEQGFNPKATTEVDFTVGERTFLAYYNPVGFKDWNFVTYTDTEGINTYIASLQWKTLLSATGLAICLMLLIRDSFRRLFIGRVLDLERATRNYAEQNEFVIADAGIDEIGQLANSFRDLVQSLEDGKSEIIEKSRALETEIEQRIRTQVSLEESERKFKALYDQSPDAIMLIDNEAWIDCNQAAVQLFEASDKNALMRQQMHELSPTYQPNGQRSQDAWDQHIKDAYHDGRNGFEWVILTLNQETAWIDVLLTLIPYEGSEILYAVMRNVSARKREEVERVRLTTAIEQAAESIMVTDTEGVILYVNPAFLELNAYSRDAVIGNKSTFLYGKNIQSDDITGMMQTAFDGEVWNGRTTHKRSDASEYTAEVTISPVKDNSNNLMNLVYVFRDVSREASMEAQLRQAQKMEAIGELASGIAHEINTPTQYVGDNIRFFRDSFGDIKELLDKFQDLLDSTPPDNGLAEKTKDIRDFIEEIDLEYLEEEVPTAIEQSLEGNKRVAEIVRAMKEFAHPGREELTSIDINHAIRNTMAVARNEWKYVAEVETELQEDMPLVPCYPGSFNQVILNMFVNAAHAIGDVVEGGDKGKGTIRVVTRTIDSMAEIRISDTGCGIPEEIRLKIFDPFFTTKEVGKGTGQGLSIAHSVIVEKHQGTIDLESTVGEGTTFIIRIPLEPDVAESAKADAEE